MSLTVMDWFCGAGGSSQGAHAVPGVDVALAECVHGEDLDRRYGLAA